LHEVASILSCGAHGIILLKAENKPCASLSDADGSSRLTTSTEGV